MKNLTLSPQTTPWQLWDVVERFVRGELVYGFELELLASFVS